MTSRANTSEAFVWNWLPGATEPVVAGRLDQDGERLLFTTAPAIGAVRTPFPSMSRNCHFRRARSPRSTACRWRVAFATHAALGDLRCAREIRGSFWRTPNFRFVIS